jgi:hypothetical protein
VVELARMTWSVAGDREACRRSDVMGGCEPTDEFRAEMTVKSLRRFFVADLESPYR